MFRNVVYSGQNLSSGAAIGAVQNFHCPQSRPRCYTDNSSAVSASSNCPSHVRTMSIVVITCDCSWNKTYIGDHVQLWMCEVDAGINYSNININGSSGVGSFAFVCFNSS